MKLPPADPPPIAAARASAVPRLVAAIAIAVFALFGYLPPAAPPASAAAGAETAETAAPASREAELEQVRGQIRRLEGELQRLSARESGVSGDLERLLVELDLQRQQVAEARAAQALARERLAASEAALERLGGELETVQQELQERLAALYRLGRHGYLRLVLSVEPGREPLAAVRWLRYLVRRDARAFRRYTEARERIAEERQSLAAWQEEAASWVAREEERRGSLTRLVRRQELLLARLGGERRQLSERTAALEDREGKLRNFIDFLDGRSGGPPSGRSIQGFRGVLDWPVRGRVTQGFGTRRDPRYGTEVPHNGVELAVAGGSEVRAVYPGKVLFASPFRGYGPTVIVHHPGRVFTLYAGLEQLSVGRDAVVALGDVLGLSTDSLYFEIRVENRAEDPRAWLR